MFRTPLTADSDKWTLSSVLLIVGLCFLSYLFVLFEAQWIWDDPDYVWRNPLLAHEGGLAAIWRDAANTPQYYPVVHTSFWLELRALGMEAVLAHVQVLQDRGGSGFPCLRKGPDPVRAQAVVT